jgi:hypothetical protein
MKKLLSLLVAAVMALSLSFAVFAEDKPAADKSTTSEHKKKGKKKSADKKKEGDAAKEAPAKK